MCSINTRSMVRYLCKLSLRNTIPTCGPTLIVWNFFLLAVPAYYALILRSLTVLEGLALYADPNFKVLAASYPYFAKRLLTDPNPYLRDALIELVFKDGKFRYITINSFNSDVFVNS